MKLLIFGATGGTGRKLVELALEQGHKVTAFARNPARLEYRHPNLQIAQGDVMQLTSVERAMQDQEVVVSALGAPASQKAPVRSEGTRNIIGAMEKAGVRRLICQTTLGMGDSRDLLPFSYKYLIVPFILRSAFADSERQENYIRQSLLEWTIIRPAALTNGQPTGVYRHGFSVGDKDLKMKISRADLADFILKQLADNSYLYKTPGVSY